MRILALPSLFLVLLVGTTAGCAARAERTVSVPLEDLGAPSWVLKGSGFFSNEHGRVIHGVCSAYGMREYDRLQATGENRAVNEVARLFDSYMALLLKDYAASVGGEPASNDAIQAVTAMTLSTVQVQEHWQNPRTGEYFCLGRLDLEAFKESLNRTTGFEAGLRDYLLENADRVHEALELE